MILDAVAPPRPSSNGRPPLVALRPDYRVVFPRTSAPSRHPLQHALGLTPVFASQTTGFKNWSLPL
jgi:hypothetical protein